MNAILQKITDLGVMPVIKIEPLECAVPLATALRKGGLNALEVTVRNDVALEAIRAIKAKYPDMLVGAGTITSAEKAQQALNARADFIVAPGFNPETVRFCQAHNTLIVPGCVTPAELEQATFQITSAGGDGLHWNYYWRDTIRTGQWTPDRNAGLEEFRKLWRPLWRELRDAAPAEPSDIAVLSAWSTMQYLERSFFTMRQDDFVTRLAAALYRDQLWPDWFSENAPGTVLDGKKLVGELSSVELFKLGIPDFFSQLKSVGFIRYFDPFEKYFAVEAASRVEDVMNRELPSFHPDATLIEVVFAISVLKQPVIYVTNHKQELQGVISQAQLLGRIINL